MKIYNKLFVHINRGRFYEGNKATWQAAIHFQAMRALSLKWLKGMSNIIAATTIGFKP